MQNKHATALWLHTNFGVSDVALVTAGGFIRHRGETVIQATEKYFDVSLPGVILCCFKVLTQ